MIECKELSRGSRTVLTTSIPNVAVSRGKISRTGSELKKSWRAKLSAKTKAA